MAITHISVRGARQHNLKRHRRQIPRNTLTVITGLSGSGKSSLAFDTIYAEGQRRYVETLSAYARQFLDQMERPDVDSIEGLSPAISIEQKTTSRSPRSTVGTITEIYDYLRLLYASIGVPHCPQCGRAITRQTAEQMVERIMALKPEDRVTVYAPIVRGRKGEFKKSWRNSIRRDSPRPHRRRSPRIDDEDIQLEKRKNHTIEARHRPRRRKARRRKAPRRLHRKSRCRWPMASCSGRSSSEGEEQSFSSSMACPDCGLNVPKLEPRSVLLQLHLRRMSGVQRPGQHVRLRSR